MNDCFVYVFWETLSDIWFLTVVILRNSSERNKNGLQFIIRKDTEEYLKTFSAAWVRYNFDASNACVED